MGAPIEIKNVTKFYGQQKVVSEVSLVIKAGECFGLLGSQGAGKSSLIEMISANSPLSGGEIYVDGLNVKLNPNRVKSVIGIVPQAILFDNDFSLLDNLMLFARYKGLAHKKALTQARENLRLLGMEDNEDKFPEQLSDDAQKRFAIVRALMAAPKILLIDEPTLILEANTKSKIWEVLSNLKREGLTILIGSQNRDEAERVCNRIAIMEKGKILSIGAPAELIRDEVGKEVVEFEVEKKELDYYLSKVRDDYEYKVLNNKVRLFVKDGQLSERAIQLFSSHNILIRRASLDDVFLKVAGHELESSL